MKPFYKIVYSLYLYKKGEENSKILGKGIISILKRLDEVSSIRFAANEMNLSYSKAVKIINRAEEELNIKLVNRCRGGNERRGCTLTEGGKKIIELWDSLNSDIEEYVSSKSVFFIEKIKDIQKSSK